MSEVRSTAFQSRAVATEFCRACLRSAAALRVDLLRPWCGLVYLPFEQEDGEGCNMITWLGL
jgi:hypothetical protein